MKKKVLKIFFFSVLFALFAYSGWNLYRIHRGEEVFFLGYKPVVVKSSTMEPLLSKNDVVIVKKVEDLNDKKIQNGSIVYFRTSQHYNTLERVTQKVSENENGEKEKTVRSAFLRTKKETSSKESIEPVTEKEILGVGILSFHTSRLVKNPWIAAVVLVIFGILLYLEKVISERLRVKKKNNEHVC